MNANTHSGGLARTKPARTAPVLKPTAESVPQTASAVVLAVVDDESAH